MSARALRVERLLALQAVLDAAWRRAYRRDDHERYDAVMDRSRAVSAAMRAAVE